MNSTTQRPIVGQEVAVRDGYSGGDALGYIVRKVTPSGQVVVKRGDGPERRFSPASRYNATLQETGSNTSFRATLILDVEGVRARNRAEQLGRLAAAAINAVKPIATARFEWSKSTMMEEVVKMEALLAAARAAVEARE